ncbi:hypothetical protein LUW74_16085 [Actinomadura madurae]|uniref:hypothetical protein n=1 Tax=Actinomadura madurae TaxID=1993 RepID=UPI00202650CD|nr:hypothetical protein [Actinomadura madurae]URN04688.1 hypothetical protein LUW74_16085 [Actinomadura madurae]
MDAVARVKRAKESRCPHSASSPGRPDENVVFSRSPGCPVVNVLITTGVPSRRPVAVASPEAAGVPPCLRQALLAARRGGLAGLDRLICGFEEPPREQGEQSRRKAAG